MKPLCEQLCGACSTRSCVAQCSLGALALLVHACHPAVICTHATPLPPRGSVPSLNHPSPLSTRNMRAPPAGIASPAVGCSTLNEAPPASFPHQPPRAQHGARCLFSRVRPISSLIRPHTRLFSLHMRGKTGTTPRLFICPSPAICRSLACLLFVLVAGSWQYHISVLNQVDGVTESAMSMY